MIIDVLTATRAEYGLMRPIIRKMQEDEEIDLRLLVTGTHLSEKYGLTYKEIENDNIPIFAKIPILSDSTGVKNVSATMATAINAFTEHFLKQKPDFLLVDGDRYETLAICIAAVNCNIPIIHCGGGATTEGAADESYRHAITKLSYLHFPSTNIYRKRIIQMGESPHRVFAVGSPGIENLKTTNFLTKEELEKSLNFKLDLPFSVVTFHPVTLENNTIEKQIQALFQACEELRDMKFIFTKANADNGGEEINQMLENFVKKSDRYKCFDSLGSRRYLSALKYCSFVMGNSSSGLIEVPSFKIPTINIGDRQKGRIKALSVIDCEPTKESILHAVQIARSNDFLENVCANVINPNGDGNTSEKIIFHIKDYYANNKIDLKKSFYNLDF